ncbi:MAG: fibronectin type III domain-containing protein [Lachnospiraceae bacterium]|nr:fibronectin type III domain-containing protein [Lachnospiraceae bacterium]
MKKRRLLLFIALCLSLVISSGGFTSLETYAASVTDSRYMNSAVTVAKDQGSNGLCWAFAAIGACEADIVNKNPSLASTLDLSELHLGYFGFNRMDDPLGNYSMAESQLQALLGWENTGQNQYAVINALASWSGLVNESDAPYTSGTAFFSGMSDSDKETIEYTKNAYVLKNAYIIDIKSKSDVKKAILDHGGVVAGFYADGGFLKWSAEHYDSANYSVYHKDKEQTDHEIVIVGWDDNFNNFSSLPNKPSKPGAWIAKNSWGTSFGDNGFFYISYEDATLARWLFAYDMVPAGEYDNNYQYDNDITGIITGATSNNEMAPVDYDFTATNGNNKWVTANVFEVSANPSGYEKLKAISFITYEPNGNYTIKIYTDLVDSANPESGKLVKTITGSYTNPGYITVEGFDVSLAEGTKFSVVVSNKNSSGKELGVSAENSGSLGIPHLTDAGKSFRNVGIWKDMTDLEGVASQIKAFTCNDTVSAVTSLSFANSDEYMALSAPGMILPLTIAPAGAQYAKISWSSSDTSVATVEPSGRIVPVATGTTTITASANGQTATCTVHVEGAPPKPNISISTYGDELFVTDDPTADGYNLYARTNESDPYEFMGSIERSDITVDGNNKFSFMPQTLEPGICYQVKVTAFKKYSGVKVESLASDYRFLDNPLDTITGLRLVSKTSTSITLSWNAGVNVREYDVWLDLPAATVSTNTATLTGLKPGTSYYPSLRAKGDKFFGVRYSSTKNFSDSITVMTPFPAVSGFKAANVTTNSVNLSWTRLNDSDYGKRVENYIITNETKGTSVTVAGSSSSYVMSGLSAGTYTFSIKAAHSTYGSVESEAATKVTVTIPPAGPVDLSKCTVTLSATKMSYTGKALKPTVTVKNSGKTIASSEYTVSYSNNTNPGTGKVTIKANSSSKLIKGSITKSFTIEKGTIKLTVTDKYTKTMSAKVQTIALKVSKNVGTLKFASDNKNVKVDAAGKVTIPKNFTGKAVITVTASATNYTTATKKVTIYVTPAKMTISKLTTSKGKINVKWAKNAYVTGYEIECSLNSKFPAKSTVSVNISKASTVTKDITKLTSKKKYYVRLRAYKTQGKEKIYGAWSASKYITVK